MQYFLLSGNRYLIHLNRKYTWEFFRNHTKVTSGTYSETLARRIYSSVFEAAINVNQEYRKYYKNEYESIHQFMFWRYGVLEKIGKQIMNPTDGYLAIFETDWQLEDNDLLKETFIATLSKLDEQK